MGEQTAISWTDHTFNPWWGCWKIADECKNCYADTHAARFAPGHWGRTAPRRFFDAKHWAQLPKWNARAQRDGVRRRVFVASMADWAEIHPDTAINAQMIEARSRLWREINACTSLDFLLLTKRIDDAAQLLPWAEDGRPWSNIWLGDRKPQGGRVSYACDVCGGHGWYWDPTGCVPDQRYRCDCGAPDSSYRNSDSADVIDDPDAHLVRWNDNVIALNRLSNLARCLRDAGASASASRSTHRRTGIASPWTT